LPPPSDPHAQGIPPGPLVEGNGRTRFRYRPASDPALSGNLIVHRAAVAGSFNGWSPIALPMERQSDGTFEAVTVLPEGLHHYKLVVNGKLWVEDPGADRSLRCPDGRGGYNSGLFVGPRGEDFGPPRPDGIHVEAMHHDPEQLFYLNVTAADCVEVRCRTLAGEAEGVRVLTGPEGPSVPMRRCRSANGFDYWWARLPVRPGRTIEYGFEAYKGRVSAILRPTDGHPWFRRNPRVTFETPDWARAAVWYQVLVSRFRNGDLENDRSPRVPWTWNWLKPFGKETEGRYYRYVWWRRYGGDLAGLREKLPYLRELGINALYLLPVFAAESEHKYDTRDYRHIDDTYGVKGSLERLSGETDDPQTWQWSESDRLFLDFIREAHAQGFRVILDVSFNHVGREHYAFQDVLRHGRDSGYADWFDITDWGPPIHWNAWDRPDGTLPCFRQDADGPAPTLREHLFAITRRWMDPDGDGDPSDGIDGWRLDVADLVAAPFWRAWRKLVKSINPQAYLTAEIWTDARHALTGDRFDGVMNYEFARRMHRFFVNRRCADRPTQFVAAMEELLSWYPTQATLVAQNLLDSHDTDRIASMMVNPDLPFDQANRIQDANPQYDLRPPTDQEYRRVRLATIVQFTFAGAPMTWYGDELGMFGADDPHCRKPMVWPDLGPFEDPAERARPEMFEHYRRLIAIRHTFGALQRGDLWFVHADDEAGTVAYVRTSPGDSPVLVIVNNSDQTRRAEVPFDLPEGTPVFDLLSGASAEIVPPACDTPALRAGIRIRPDAAPAAFVRSGKVALTLPPYAGAVLASRPPGADAKP